MHRNPNHDRADRTNRPMAMMALAAAVAALAFVPLAMADGGSSDESCFSGTSHPDVTSHVTWTTGASSTTIRVTFSKNFVDNTYGVNAVGWGSHGHKFKDLVGSDHVVLALYNGAGSEVMEPKVDYISQDASAPSGYRTLGVSGGDGGMNLGSASDVLAAETSLSRNFNTYGYVLTQDSPATDANYTPNAAAPNWIYDVWYEVTVKSSAFGPSGFDHANMTFVHASPSKTGSASETVAPTPCPPPPSPPPCGSGEMQGNGTTSGTCGPPPCGNGGMGGNGSSGTGNGTCAPPPCGNGTMTGQNGSTGQGNGTCSSTSTSAQVPFFPTTASLVLAGAGATGAGLILLRSRRRGA